MNGSTAAQRLSIALRDDDLRDATSIDDDQVDQLLELFEAERRRRTDALTDAIENGLVMVPKPLRGVVKKLVFPR